MKIMQIEQQNVGRVVLLLSILLTLCSCLPITNNRNNSSNNSSLQSQDTSTQNRQKHIKYLKQFGHLNTAASTRALPYSVDDVTVADDDAVDDMTLADAIRSLQRFAGLNVTGVVDSATEQLINTPRCGVADLDNNNNNNVFTGRRRNKRFVASRGWSVSKLKFFIDNNASSKTINAATISRRVEEAYKQWSAAAQSLSIDSTSNRSEADIILSFYSYKHTDNWPFDGPGGVLAHTFFPPSGTVHFDDSEPWSDGTSEGRNFYYVALHELGHSLGLSHSTVKSAIMSPYYGGYRPNLTLSEDDIAGIRQIYDCREVEPPPVNHQPTAVSNINNGGSSQSITPQSTRPSKCNVAIKTENSRTATPPGIMPTESTRTTEFTGRNRHKPSESSTSSSSATTTTTTTTGNLVVVSTTTFSVVHRLMKQQHYSQLTTTTSLNILAIIVVIFVTSTQCLSHANDNT